MGCYYIFGSVGQLVSQCIHSMLWVSYVLKLHKFCHEANSTPNTNTDHTTTTSQSSVSFGSSKTVLCMQYGYRSCVCSTDASASWEIHAFIIWHRLGQHLRNGIIKQLTCKKAKSHFSLLFTHSILSYNKNLLKK